MIASSLTNGTLTLVTDDAQIITARNDHPKWNELIEAFKSGNETLLRSLLSLQAVVEEYTVGTLSVSKVGVTYGGRPLHTIDAERVMAFLRDGLPYQPIANYIVRKMKNPSSRAIQEMYNFLEHRGMPLTSKGTFIAYKGVDPDFWSIAGNKDTIVLQGEVNPDGKIRNTIGSVIEVERSSVDDDFRRGCSHGLHAGSLEYARGWGRRVVLVEIDPADVVSVPEDCNCQKLRCCKYTVIAEYTGPMPDTLTTEFDDEDVCHQCGGPEGDCNCEDNDEPCDCGLTSCESCGPDALERQDSAPTVPSETPDESWIQSKTAVEDTNVYGEPRTKETARELLNLTLTDTFKRIVAMIAEQCGIPEKDIEPTTTMNSELLMLDSLDGVELAMALEEEFGFEIPDEDAEKANGSTVAEICKYIEDRLERERARTRPSDPNFQNGLAEGMQHRALKIPAKYFAGDEVGADSQPHGQYILGYVAGYDK